MMMQSRFSPSTSRCCCKRRREIAMNVATTMIFLVIIALLSALVAPVMGWQSSPSHKSIPFTPRRSTGSTSGAGSSRSGPTTMYMPPNTPTSEPPHFTAQKMLKNSAGVVGSSRNSLISNSGTIPAAASRIPGGGRKESLSNNKISRSEQRKSMMKLSNSVLASCDTLPSFPTAHGLLSPETVMRLDESCRNTNKAINNFLDTYSKEGPLACLPMLSDPDVLPFLTKAMRDIAA